MNERWQEFLNTQQLARHPDGYTHHRDEHVDAFQKLSGDSICDLSHTLITHTLGADSDEFLQNQLTNDVASLDDQHATVAGYCNPKGRLISLFHIWRVDGGFMLQLPRDLETGAIDRLRKYVLRARVEFSSDPDVVTFGICGKTVARTLERNTTTLPKRDRQLVRSGELTIIRIPGDGRPRFQVVGPVDACVAIWRKLTRHTWVAGSWTWSRIDILAGVPNITAATSELFIPQMVNLDRLDAINFRKGCYPGQEIVARMHYRGKLKQRMGRFRVDGDVRPRPGNRVYSPDSDTASGTVVDAQPGAGAGWDLLAVVRITDFEQQGLHLEGENGVSLFWQDLPYPVTDPGQESAR